jgi:hypothetical protein
MGNKITMIEGLNEVREQLFKLYPNATKISVVFDGEKIKVTPNEEYVVPLDVDGLSSEEE